MPPAKIANFAIPACLIYLFQMEMSVYRSAEMEELSNLEKNVMIPTNKMEMGVHPCVRFSQITNAKASHLPVNVKMFNLLQTAETVSSTQDNSAMMEILKTLMVALRFVRLSLGMCVIQFAQGKLQECS